MTQRRPGLARRRILLGAGCLALLAGCRAGPRQSARAPTSGLYDRLLSGYLAHAPETVFAEESAAIDYLRLTAPSAYERALTDYDRRDGLVARAHRQMRQRAQTFAANPTVTLTFDDALSPLDPGLGAYPLRWGLSEVPPVVDAGIPMTRLPERLGVDCGESAPLRAVPQEAVVQASAVPADRPRQVQVDLTARITDLRAASSDDAARLLGAELVDLTVHSLARRRLIARAELG